MQLEFRNRVIVVTGAASGIDGACAKALSSGGARVAAADKNAEAAQRTAEALAAIAFVVDVGDEDQVNGMAAAVEQQLGPIDVLVNGARVLQRMLPPGEPGFQNAIEGFNGLWQSKGWHRHHCDDVSSLAAVSKRYIAAYRAKTATRREAAPTRRRFPARFKLDLGATLRGTMIFVRRSTEKGNVNLLNKDFSVDGHWLHRLVRCEVDFTHHQRIRFYALRRRDPTAQPLLRDLPYPGPIKPFKGIP